MLVSVLRARHPACSPGAKFVLLRFIQLYGVDTSVGQSVKAMAKEVGVTDRVAGEALPQLIAQGLLAQQSNRGKLGRPSSSYTCPKAALAERVDLEGGGGSSSEHAQRIAKLLSGAVSQPTQRLMYANRLLLAVLVAHADEFGIVRGLGWRDIGELTGLRRAVLRQRLEMLLEQGYIRSAIPGVTGTTLFKKAKSEYVLNLAHSLLRVDKNPILVVVRTRFSPHIGIYPARLILDAVIRSPGARYVAIGNERYDVGGLFEGKMILRLEPILQASIDRYASYLLSEQFDAITDDRSSFNDLRVRIREDFTLVGTGYEATAVQVDIVRLLHDEAVRWARDIKAALNLIEGVPVNDVCKYWLLPPTRYEKKDKLAWVLLVRTNDESVSFGCRVYDQKTSLNLSCQSDEELAFPVRCLYGLLTRSKHGA